MAEINNTISAAIRGLGPEYYEFFKAIMERAFEKDPAMKERYLQVERDYDKNINTSLRRTAPDFIDGELPPGVFILTSATKQIVKTRLPLWLNRARYLAHEERFTFNWFFIEGRWARCVTIGVLSAAFAKYYPGDIV